jgi:hypothetical protein
MTQAALVGAVIVAAVSGFGALSTQETSSQPASSPDVEEDAV